MTAANGCTCNMVDKIGTVCCAVDWLFLLSDIIRAL